MTSTLKRSMPAAATLALAMMFGAQAQAQTQTPLPPTAPAVVKGDQMAPPAPGGTSTQAAPAVRMPQNNNVSNTATPPVSKAKPMTMQERNESRMKREMAATNGGTTSPEANNVSNGATSVAPAATGKTRAERKAERDAKRMAKSGAADPAMVKP